MDFPARIIAAAVRVLPRDRREWAAAMAAELAHLPQGSDRWGFALGCARTALFAPQHPNAAAPRAVVTGTFLAGVAGCLAITAYVLTKWPHAAGDINRATSITFTAALTAYLWIALRTPAALVAHREAARHGAGIGFALFVAAASGRSVIDAVVPPGDDLIVGWFVVVTVLGTIVATAFAAARRERSFGAGVTASLWLGLVCSMLTFNAELIAILAGFNLDVHMRNVAPGHYQLITEAEFMRKHIGGHLDSAMEGLRTLPVLTIIIGSIGAALGRRTRAA